MESSDSIDKSWDTTSDLTSTTTTALRSDPLASGEAPSSGPGGWMVNVAGRDIVEMAHAVLIAKFRKGELSGATLVWREGMETWAKLETVPAFQLGSKPPLDETDEASGTETNPVAVYERPMATLEFDEAVEDEWKAQAKPREPSKSVRAAEPSTASRSASARPVAPSFPSPASSRSPVVPADEPPPPPPLPPRRSAAPEHGRRPQPTIPGGLVAPTPPPASVAPAKKPTPLPSAPPASALRPSASPIRPSPSPASAALPSARPAKSPAPPATTTSALSPLLAAIAEAASQPAPVPVAAPATPGPAVQSLSPVTVPDESSVVAPFGARKSVPLRSAVLACAGSALIASVLTGLVVGSGSRDVARPASEARAKTVAATAAIPLPAPTAAPNPAPAAPAPAAEATSAPVAATAQKVGLTELAVAEKPKPKPAKVSSWKPPKLVEAAADGAEVEKPAPNPERDDPLRAVPDRATESSSTQQTDWQENPGF